MQDQLLIFCKKKVLIKVSQSSAFVLKARRKLSYFISFLFTLFTNIYLFFIRSRIVQNKVYIRKSIVIDQHYVHRLLLEIEYFLPILFTPPFFRVKVYYFRLIVLFKNFFIVELPWKQKNNSLLFGTRESSVLSFGNL